MQRADNERIRPPERSDSVALGIVGAGRLAERVHFGMLARQPGCRVVAIADPSNERRDVARRRFPGAELCKDLAELLDRADVDAIIVSSPPTTHASAACLALQAGKHVYVEKPIATELGEAERLTTVWRQSGRIGMVGFNYRFHPAVLELKRQLARGRLGRPLFLLTTFTAAPRNAVPWQGDRRSGGGALLELGSHHFDLAPFLLDEEPREIAAALWARSLAHDTAAISMRLSGGVHVQSFFALGASDQDRIQVIGDAATAELDRLSGVLRFEPAQFEYGRRATLRRELQRACRSFRTLTRPIGEPSYAAALHAFVAAVRTGVQPRPSIEDGLRSLLLVDAAERSSAVGAPVVVGEAVQGGAAVLS